MFWGLSSIEWTALAAIGTLALALATLSLGGVTVWAVRSERRRDDQLRRAEGEAQADRDARQVLVSYDDQAGEVTVSAPHSHPIKRVDGCWVEVYGNLVIKPFPTSHNDPETDNERTYYRFPAKRDLAKDKPAIRFTDWHRNLYYYYRGHTLRLPGDTDWQEGVFKVDVWVGTGPMPGIPHRGKGHRIMAWRRR